MSRTKIDQSARALTETNTELEQRRRHIETILENIPTGVLSLDTGKARDAQQCGFRADVLAQWRRAEGWINRAGSI